MAAPRRIVKDAMLHFSNKMQFFGNLHKMSTGCKRFMLFAVVYIVFFINLSI